jgi:hypothetical protein
MDGRDGNSGDPISLHEQLPRHHDFRAGRLTCSDTAGELATRQSRERLGRLAQARQEQVHPWRLRRGVAERPRAGLLPPASRPAGGTASAPWGQQARGRVAATSRPAAGGNRRAGPASRGLRAARGSRDALPRSCGRARGGAVLSGLPRWQILIVYASTSWD